MREIMWLNVFLVFFALAAGQAQSLGDLEQTYTSIFNKNKSYAVTVSVSAVPSGKSNYYPPAKSQGYETAIGSGFIYDSLGHIITSSSVTNQGNLFKITFIDGSTRFADLVGTSLENSISILKVNGVPFPPPKYANSDDISPGSWIGVIGNFFGIFPSFATGIISSRNDNDNFLVTADISPGSAGGLVVNSKNEIVGMIAFKLTETVNLNHILINDISPNVKKSLVMTDAAVELPVGGFSLVISSQKIVKMANEVIGNKSSGAFLGIVPEDLDVTWAKRVFNINYGVYLTSVEDQSPAYNAGIREGDILLEYNRHRILNSEQLRKLIYNTAVDEEVSIKILRAGRIRTITAQLDTYKNVQLQKTKTDSR